MIKSQMSCAQIFRKFSASASLGLRTCARAAAAAAHGCMLSVAPRTPVAVLRPRGARGGARGGAKAAQRGLDRKK